MKSVLFVPGSKEEEMKEEPEGTADGEEKEPVRINKDVLISVIFTSSANQSDAVRLLCHHPQSV